MIDLKVELNNRLQGRIGEEALMAQSAGTRPEKTLILKKRLR